MSNFVNTKLLYFTTLLCVLFIIIFEIIPWAIGFFGYNEFYNSELRYDVLFTSHLYIIIPLIGSLTLTPLLVKNPKKVSLWIILALLWLSFLQIIIYTILVVLRIVPAQV